ncbi:MAG: DOMON-like domain-containing protein [Phormidesmis sp.]
MRELTTFTLVPFEPLPTAVDLSITGTLTREDNLLTLSYLMAGDIDAVALPAFSTTDTRQDRLWEQTCFEFFLTASAKKSDQAPYWEFNLSPTGAWNVFALDGYRQGLREELAFTQLPFSVRRSSEGLRLDASIDLSGLDLSDSQWLLGVSTVCVLTGGEETFWAIAHPGPQADFHSAGSFAIQLSP